MKYNSKYDRYVDDDLVIYRFDKNKDRLIQCKQFHRNRYLLVFTKLGLVSVHRLVYETFVGEIPKGMNIDHLNTIRDDNRLENLRLCSQKENCNNPLTRKHYSEARTGKTKSEFGAKFKEHYGITYYENIKLYKLEHNWYYKHNKVCRWEAK